MDLRAQLVVFSEKGLKLRVKFSQTLKLLFCQEHLEFRMSLLITCYWPSPWWSWKRHQCKLICRELLTGPETYLLSIDLTFKAAISFGLLSADTKLAVDLFSLGIHVMLNPVPHLSDLPLEAFVCSFILGALLFRYMHFHLFLETCVLFIIVDQILNSIILVNISDLCVSYNEFHISCRAMAADGHLVHVLLRYQLNVLVVFYCWERG